MARYDDWAFKVFLCATLFIVIFSVAAIHSWPPMAKHATILLACILPVAMVVLVRIPIWFSDKKVPKEVLWALLVFILGIVVSLRSENSWITMKSTVLFVASGPFIFIATWYLFKSTKNQEVFLWMTSLIILCFGFLGFYEDNYSGGILLFSENLLPAGASLILLSISPMILLTRKRSTPLKLALILSLVSSVILIILLAKKGPILSLIVILLFSVGFVKRKHLKLLLGLALLAGCLLLTSESTLLKYKNILKLNSSITLRAEHYFFGFHVFKKKPVWGVGYHPDLFNYFYCDNSEHHVRHKHRKDLCINEFNYNPAFFDQQRNFYWGYLTTLRTFENIVLSFLVEMGGLFSAVYFGGVIYIFAVFFKKFRAPPQKNLAGMLTIAVMVGFTFISCTFDTLRFPNLNWLFHSLLGLMVNLPQNSSENHSEPS
jgi:O-antigen ligase